MNHSAPPATSRGTDTAPGTVTSPGTVSGLLAGISDVGADGKRGGYTRPVYSTAELELRAWFHSEAARRGLDVGTDRKGVIWAWWDTPSGIRENALVTGSHLDSVPGGGQFDGPLGVASALAAIDVLKARGTVPRRPTRCVHGTHRRP